MTDKRAFEALLDDLLGASFDQDWPAEKKARAAVLAAYEEAAGREGQPPVAYLYPDDLAELERVGAAMVYQERQRFSILPHQEPAMALFTHPAPKAVKLPARQELFSDTGPLDAAFVRGWNACLDAIAQRAGGAG